MNLEGLEIGPSDWSGFETVMGEKGGSGGCWCMLWRLPRKTFEAGAGAGNRAAMQRRFEDGPPPGLLARVGGTPAAWLQVDRREAFSRLATSRILQPVDDQPVWSVACFLIARP
ncbi:MAG: GNAT family N-acetyltransferase, partial [Pseudomonadota bacterium]